MSLAPLHRTDPARPPLRVVRDEPVVIQPYARAVYIGQTELGLTRREYDLLLFLVEHPRHVFTRSQLLDRVWGHVHAGERTVDVHIRRLRARLGSHVVTTVRGVGYRLADHAGIVVDG
jgi:DNA-binding response OmpR family regulator